MSVTLRRYRPEDYEIVRRWIDDPLITGGFPTAAPPHADDEVRAIVHIAERRALEAIGFTAEGVLRRYFDGEGDLGDLVMYAMTRDEWEEARAGWNSTG